MKSFRLKGRNFSTMVLVLALGCFPACNEGTVSKRCEKDADCGGGQAGFCCRDGECRSGADCEVKPGCGNGVLDPGEDCEAADVGGKTCQSLGFVGGQLKCSAACAFDTAACLAGNDCGNERKDPAEDCDGAELGGQTCLTQGFGGGEIKCAPNCRFDTSGCTAEDKCGNQKKDSGEDCDGADLGAESCLTIGFIGGSLKCTPQCTFDTSGCVSAENCGNQKKDLIEDCDGNDLGGRSCTDLGFPGGALACSPACRFEMSGCTSGNNCGNLVADSGEDCDGSDLRSQTCETLGFSAGLLRCSATCRFDMSACNFASTCGNQRQDAGEECDGIDLGDQTCQTVGFGDGELRCAPDCKHDTSRCIDTQCSPVATPRLYVSTTGDDANPGTIQQPLKTVKHALSIAAPGSTIYLLRGSFNEGFVEINDINFDSLVTVTSLGKVNLDKTGFLFWGGKNIAIERFHFTGGETADNRVRNFSNLRFRNNTFFRYGGAGLTLYSNSRQCVVENNTFAHSGYAHFQPGSAGTDAEGHLIAAAPTHHNVYRNNIGYFDGHNGLNAGNCINNNLYENNIHFGSASAWNFFSANGGPCNHHNTLRNNVAWINGGGVFGAVEDSLMEGNMAFNGSVGLEVMSTGDDGGTATLCPKDDNWQCRPSKRNILRNNWVFNNFSYQITFSGPENSVLENNRVSGEGDTFGAGHVIWDYPGQKKAFGNVIKDYPIGSYMVSGNSLDFSFVSTDGRVFEFGEILPEIGPAGGLIKASYKTAKFAVFNIRIRPDVPVTADVLRNELNTFATEFTVTPKAGSASLTITVDKLTPGQTYPVKKAGGDFVALTASDKGEIVFTDTINSLVTYSVSGSNAVRPTAAPIMARDLKYFAPDTALLTRRWLFVGKDDNGFGTIQDLRHEWRVTDSAGNPITPAYQWNTSNTTPAAIMEFPADGFYIVSHKVTNSSSQSDEKTARINVQTRFAEVEGLVLDAAGAPVDGAVVRLTTGNGTVIERTHANGYYCFQDVPIGQVGQIHICRNGFNKYEGTTPSIEAEIVKVPEIRLSASAR